MTCIFLVAIALVVSTAALNGGDIDKEYKFMLNPLYAGSRTKAEESTIVEHIGEAYDFRSNNGVIYPLRYALASEEGYQTFQEGIQQFQILSSVFQRDKNSSDAGDGTSLENIDPQNTNAKETVSSYKDTPHIDPDNSSSDGHVSGQNNINSNNYGTLFPVRYILAPQYGYHTYGEGTPQYQIPSSIFEPEKNSSGPQPNKDIFSGGKKQRNTNVSEAINFSEGTEDTNAAEQANVELGNYRDDDGAHSTVHYILNHHVGYQPYGEVLPQIEITSNKIDQHQASSNPKSKNGTYAPDIERKNTSSSEDTLESQQLSKNTNLVSKSYNPFNMKAQEKNSNNTDFNEAKMLEKEVSNTTVEPTVSEDAFSAPSFSLNGRPGHNSQSYADFLTSSLKMYHNEFPFYWIANHPSIGSNDLSSSYFVSNHLTYPAVPLYYHLVL